MLPYFPLRDGVFEHQFGIAALGSDRPLIAATEAYGREIGERRRLLDSAYRSSYLVEPASARRSVRETCGLLVDRGAVFLRRHDAVVQSIDGQTAAVDEISLDWLGRNIQEDVAILRNDPQAGFPLIAGCVCFPSGWSLQEKVGKSVLAIHREVPDFDQSLYPATRRLMNQLKPGKTVWRTNWGIRPSSQLDQSPRHRRHLSERLAAVTAQNAGTNCFFRVEFQTLTRLEGGDIVFTIKTDQCPLIDLTESQRAVLIGVLQTCPAETLRYKGIQPIYDAIVSHLAT